MSLESSTASIRKRLGDDSGLDATIKLDFLGDGVIFIDAISVPNQVTNEDKDAQCTMRMSLSDFEAMIAGQLEPTTAFMEGRLEIEGDMGVAMKLQSLV